MQLNIKKKTFMENERKLSSKFYCCKAYLTNKLQEYRNRTNSSD